MDNLQYSILLSSTTLPLFYFFSPSFAIWYAFSSLSHMAIYKLTDITHDDEIIAFGCVFGLSFSTLQLISCGGIISSEESFFGILFNIYEQLNAEDIIGLPVVFFGLCFLYLYSLLILPLFSTFSLSVFEMLSANILGTLTNTLGLLYFKEGSDRVVNTTSVVIQEQPNLPNTFNNNSNDSEYEEIIEEAIDNEIIIKEEIPNEYYCPISLSIMSNPYYVRNHRNHRFDYNGIAQWVIDNHTNPLNREPLQIRDLIRDEEMYKEILDFVNDLREKLEAKKNNRLRA